MLRAALVLLALAGPAFAERTAHMNRICNPHDVAYDHMYCFGYFVGVAATSGFQCRGLDPMALAAGVMVTLGGATDPAADLVYNDDLEYLAGSNGPCD